MIFEKNTDYNDLMKELDSKKVANVVANNKFADYSYMIGLVKPIIYDMEFKIEFAYINEKTGILTLSCSFDKSSKRNKRAFREDNNKLYYEEWFEFNFPNTKENIGSCELKVSEKILLETESTDYSGSKLEGFFDILELIMDVVDIFV